MLAWAVFSRKIFTTKETKGHKGNPQKTFVYLTALAYGASVVTLCG
jgi:hypothetical protein